MGICGMNYPGWEEDASRDRHRREQEKDDRREIRKWSIDKATEYAAQNNLKD